jgi:hypothetical protein
MKFSNCPHPVEILLGLLSSILAFAAFLAALRSIDVSKQSLQTSQEALQVGQKAYLNIRNVRLAVTEPVRSKVQLSPGQHELALKYRFTLENLGNTPALINKNSEGFITQLKYPDQWDKPNAVWDNRPGVIGPHSSVEVEAGTEAGLSGSGYEHYLRQLKILPKKTSQEQVIFERNQIYGENTLKYQDIFGKQHYLHWCWTENMMSPYVYADDCTEEKHRN